MKTVTVKDGLCYLDDCLFENQRKIKQFLPPSAWNPIGYLTNPTLLDGDYSVSPPPAVKVEQFQFNAGTWINRPKEDQFAPRSTKIRYRTVWRFVEEKFEPIIIHDPLVGSHESQEKLWMEVLPRIYANESLDKLKRDFTISRK